MQEKLNIMNNFSLNTLAIMLVIFITTAFAGAKHDSEREENISYFFKLNENGQLFLKIRNESAEVKLLEANIDHLLGTGISGFPQKAAIQFRSKNKKTVLLKDQEVNGWLYPNIYNSVLDIRLIPRGEKPKEENNFSNLLLESNSSASFLIDYSTGMRLVASELRSLDSEVGEFRVMWEIVIKESDVITRKQIISDWFSCESIVAKIIKESN